MMLISYFYSKPLLQILANVLKRVGWLETSWPAALIICIEQTDSIVLDPIGPQFLLIA